MFLGEIMGFIHQRTMSKVSNHTIFLFFVKKFKTLYGQCSTIFFECVIRHRLPLVLYYHKMCRTHTSTHTLFRLLLAALHKMHSVTFSLASSNSSVSDFKIKVFCALFLAFSTHYKYIGTTIVTSRSGGA